MCIPASLSYFIVLEMMPGCARLELANQKKREETSKLIILRIKKGWHKKVKRQDWDGGDVHKACIGITEGFKANLCT